MLSASRITRNLQRDLWQKVTVASVSDSVWTISPPTQREIFQKLLDAQEGDALPINLVLIYAFDRPQPAGQQRADKELPIINILDPGTDDRQQIIDALRIALDPDARCQDNPEIEFYVKNWIVPTVRLPSTIKPKLIKRFDLAHNIYISRNCEVNENTGITSFWWEVTQKFFKDDNGNDQGLVFLTWSEKVTQQLVDYSFVTFYIVIVLGIGRALRAVIETNSESLFIKEMPKPDSLLLICEGILISRLENNLEREEELYYVLIDIMRSPEILKMISESSLRTRQTNEYHDEQ